MQKAQEEEEPRFSGTPDISLELGESLMQDSLLESISVFAFRLFGHGADSQDFVASWLSEWVYFVDPVKPSAVPLLKSPGCSFSLHSHSRVICSFRVCLLHIKVKKTRNYEHLQSITYCTGKTQSRGDPRCNVVVWPLVLLSFSMVPKLRVGGEPVKFQAAEKVWRSAKICGDI